MTNPLPANFWFSYTSTDTFLLDLRTWSLLVFPTSNELSSLWLIKIVFSLCLIEKDVVTQINLDHGIIHQFRYSAGYCLKTVFLCSDVLFNVQSLLLILLIMLQWKLVKTFVKMNIITKFDVIDLTYYIDIFVTIIGTYISEQEEEISIITYAMKISILLRCRYYYLEIFLVMRK